MRSILLSEAKGRLLGGDSKLVDRSTYLKTFVPQARILRHKPILIGFCNRYRPGLHFL